MALGNHSAFIDVFDDLWMCGDNANGQIGFANNSVDNPNLKKVKSNVKNISLGISHTGFVDKNNFLFMFGNNRYGQLGIGTNIDVDTGVSTPTKIMEDAKYVACGGYHTAVIKNDNSLWLFGYNTFGQIGSNLISGNSNPIPKKVMDDVRSVACGNDFTAVIKNDNTLWMFGNNRYGQLGHTTNSGNATPNSTPIKVIDNVKHVVCGLNHTAVIKNDNSLWTFGLNQNAQLGNNTNNATMNPNPTPVKIMENIKFVSCGNLHTLIITKEDVLLTFGSNQYGQLGITTNNGNSNPNLPTKIMNDVKTAVCGGNHTILTKKNGETLSFGFNNKGQLGISLNSGTTTVVTTPTKVDFRQSKRLWDIPDYLVKYISKYIKSNKPNFVNKNPIYLLEKKSTVDKQDNILKFINESVGLDKESNYSTNELEQNTLNDIEIVLDKSQETIKCYNKKPTILGEGRVFSQKINAYDFSIKRVLQYPLSYRNIIPIMTSNNSPSGRCFGNNLYSTTYDYWKAFNQTSVDENDTWLSANATFPLHIGYEFPKIETVSSYAITPRKSSVSNPPRDWTFEGSNDGSSWTVLHSVSNCTFSSNTERKEFMLGREQTYKMFRINITNYSPTSGYVYVGISQFEILQMA